MMTNNNQVRVYKVSNSENNSDNCNNDSEIMLNNNNNKEIFENGVSKSDTISNSRNDESIKSVEVRNGVVMSIDELERGYEESLRGYEGQRANFPCGICEGEASQMLEDKGSSRVFVGGKWSPKCPLIFCGLPDKARWSLNNVVLPSVD